MTKLRLTTHWLLRDVKGPVRVSHEVLERYKRDRAGVVAETAREAKKLQIQAERAVAAGWRPVTKEKAP